MSSGAESGEIITRVKSDAKDSLNLLFNNRRENEFTTAREFWKAHYPAQPFTYRDDELIPPRDLAVRFRLGEVFKRKTKSANLVDYGFAVDEV